MKAAIFYGVGDVRIEEIPDPHAGPGEVVIKVESALTCGTDVKTWRRGHPLRKGHTIFGHECSGTVVEVGSGVTKFSVGDRIATHNSATCNACYFCKVGQTSMCSNRVKLDGAFAQYVRIPAPIVEQNAFKMPDDLSFQAAALLEPFACAVYGVDQADIKLGDVVVVNGAGPIGLMILRCAVMRGAYVISCDMSDERLEVAKKLGAAEVINISRVDDQVKAVRERTPDGRGVDVAIEAVGLPEVWEKTIKMARKGGTVVLFGGCKSGTTITLDTELLHYSQLTIKGVFHTTQRHVSMAFDMICRKVITPDIFVTGRYPLDRVVDAIQAHARQEGIKNEIVCW
ncbi:MAG TPA: zinc-binding dehydrogenase [Firmicutes bacterium]|nr:zinc-binding dehydrogenase [Candidatus Fermentithermobacillaceae bacterium]